MFYNTEFLLHGQKFVPQEYSSRMIKAVWPLQFLSLLSSPQLFVWVSLFLPSIYFYLEYITTIAINK